MKFQKSKAKGGHEAVEDNPAPGASPSQISGDVKAPTIPESDAPKVPEAKAASPVAGVRSPSVTPVATQAGPGRPPKRPRCLRCGRKLHLCKCAKGALLAKQVEQAVETVESAPKNKFTTAEAEQILRMALYALGIVESGIAAIVSRMSWNEAQQVWSYDEKEVALLLPPAAKVLAKYADKLPVLFTKYRDEMALAWTFLQVTNAKISRSVEIIAKKHATEIAAPPAREEKSHGGSVTEISHSKAVAHPGTVDPAQSPAKAQVM